MNQKEHLADLVNRLENLAARNQAKWEKEHSREWTNDTMIGYYSGKRDAYEAAADMIRREFGIE